MKNYIKKILIPCYKFFLKNKTFFYTNPLFLGGIIDLVYLLASKKKIILVIDPKVILKKNLNINKKIFLIAYEKLNKKKFNFFSNFIYYLLFRLVRYEKDFKKFFASSFIHNNKSVFKVLQNYHKISFNYKENIKNNFLRNLIKKKIILFHCRDEAFKKKIMNFEMSYHSYRNENLAVYERAISQFKEKKNYALVRFGSVAKEKCKDKNIFDYTFSKIRNEVNDIHLIKNCKVYVGTGSGPDTLAINFQKPIVYVNWVHLPNLFTFQKNVVVIFKKIFDNQNKSFLKFKDLLNENYFLKDKKTPVGLYYTSKQYEDNNLKLINNSEDEIYYAINEMLNFLDGRFKFNEDLQNKFKKIYYKNNYNKINNNFYISDYFIKKNFDIFE